MATLFDENRFEEAIDSKIVKMINAKAVSSKSYNARVTRKDSSGTWWVRIPGNDFDTPVLVSKADMSVGDIVTVIIDTEKHVTIVDGNLTSPPSSTYNSQLYVDEIVGEKLRVTYADISVLKADYAQIQYAMIEDADITNARIQNLIYETTRQAEQIEANKAYIDDLEANNITAQTLSADHATIETLDATYATIDNLDAESARITTLEADNVTVNQKITAAEGDIATLKSNKADITYLEANYATIDNLDAERARITTLEADNVTVNQKITAAEGRIGTLESDNVTVNQKITAAEGDIATLKSNKADISYLESDYIKADVIEANYAQANLANVNNAWIENGTIKDAAIVDAQILGVSANKLTAGTIDASKINVANLRAKNLVVEKLNGQPVLGGYELVNSNMSGYSSKNPASEGWYEYSNGEWTASTDTAVVESKVYYKDADQVELYDQTYIDGLEDTLNQRIDGAVETFTGSVVPTMVNYPVSDWTSSQYASHVGDIYYVVNQSSDENGYCYRFAYDNTTHSYQWVLIKDSDVTKALSDISDLQAFESETSSWIDETDEGLRTIRTNHTALSGVVDKTVKSSVQLWFTKANTTAPSAPTSKVETNNVSTANAWNLAVPTYNASYPNYYYCWQYQYADNTYGWSAVVRDVAMGETQSTARSAQTTADANIKSSVMLWFSKSDATAPSKPTSQVTSTGTGGNAWTTVVPTWNASYPHYFYCYQQQKGDGTWQWTDVVYDRATSEAQQKASAALPASTFTNFQQTTFKELVDEVDEQSSTISTLSSRVDQKADGSTVTTLSNTVNTVKQTADTNKTSITNLTTTTQTLRNDLDNLEVGGRNLLLRDPKAYSASSYGAYDLALTEALEAGQQYTIQLWDVDVSHTGKTAATLGVNVFYCGGSVNFGSWIGTDYFTDGHADYLSLTFTPTTAQTTHSHVTGATVKYIRLYNSVPSASGTMSMSIGKWKLEKGNKATDWSPAPEDTEASITEIRTTTTNKFNEVEQTLEGIETSIGVIQNDLTEKADGTTVSTLTTKVNNISDTVDGHTQTIQSVQQTQTTQGNTLKTAIKSSTQLWFSKADTTAPAKPASHVSSTATTGNAWTTAVPAYNASYPNYFYCYEWQYTDGTYGWSGVTRDIAMGESQAQGRKGVSDAAAAQNTANKNVKTSVQLWFTKANETAPSKPASKVTTNNASTGNAWNLAVPTYNASYKYYFYCYQYELADGTYTWSDVVYDRATTENQATSRAASAGVSTLTTKTNEISDTVDGHTQKITHVTKTANAQGTGTVDYSMMGIWEQGTTSGEAVGKTYEQMKANDNTRIRFESIMPITAGTYKVTIVSGFHCLYETFDKDGKMVNISSWRSNVEFDLSISASEKYIVFFLRKGTGSDNILPEEAEDSKLRITYEYASDSEFQETKTDYATFKQTVNAFQSTIGTTYATKTELSQASSASEITKNAEGQREIVTTDAAPLPLITLTAYGESVQEGTPSPDSPVYIEAVRGRNLLTKSQTQPSAWTHSIANTTEMTGTSENLRWEMVKTGGFEHCYIEVPVQIGQIYTLSVEYQILKAFDLWNTSFDFGLHVDNAQPGSGNDSTIRIASIPMGHALMASPKIGYCTFTPTTDSVWINVPGGYVKDGSTNVPVMFSNMQLEIGSKMTRYSEQGAIGVTAHGKNLLPLPSWDELVKYPISGSYYNYPLQLKPNTTYHLNTQWTDVALAKQCGYILVGTTVGNATWVAIAHQSSGYSNANITAPADGILYFNVYATQTQQAQYEQMLANAKPQLEEGTAATSYEPYWEHVSYLDLKGNELHGLDDTYRDQLDILSDGTVQLTKRTKKITWDDITNFSSNSTRVNCSTNPNSDVVVPAAAEVPLLLSPYLVAHQWSGTTVPGTSFLNPSGGAIGWNFAPGSASDLATLKTVYSRVYSVHPLSEPYWYTISLGKIDLPQVDDGSTVHVAAEVQPYIDASWWTKAGYSVGRLAQQTKDAQGTLEAPYTELEWVESDGTQFVYLDWKPPIATWGFEADFIIRNAFTTTNNGWNAATNKNNSGLLFGTQNASQVNDIQVGAYSTSGMCRIGGTSGGSASSYDAKWKKDQARQQIKLHGTTLTCADGSTVTVTRATEVADKPYANMTVFAYHVGVRRSGTGNLSWPGSSRIYSLKFFDGDELKVDLVGAKRKKDGMTGLYDKVKGHFYPAKDLLCGNEVGDLGEPDTVVQALSKQNLTAYIDNRAVSRMWEVEIPTLDKLEDGQQITVVFQANIGNSTPNQIAAAGIDDFAGQWDETVTSNYANVYLKLILSDGSKTEWIPCYYSQGGRLTSHYGSGTPVLLTYHENMKYAETTTSIGYAVMRGWWADPNYNVDTQYDKYSDSVIAGKNGIKRYTLCMKDDAGNWTSITTTANNANATGKVAYSGPLQLGKVLFAVSAAEYAAGANSGVMAQTYPGLDFRYSVNGVQNSTATQLQLRKSVYLVGTLNDGENGDGFFYLDTTKWWTQDEPVSEDGKVYILVGTAYGSYYAIFLAADNPVYEFRDGKFQEFAYSRFAKVETDFIQTREQIGLTAASTLNSAKTYADGQVANEVVQRNAAILASANSITSTVSANYATKTIGNENLTPMFSSHNADGTYPDGNADGYWQPTTDKQYNRSAFSALDDGWIHVSVSGTSQHEFAPARVEDLEAGETVTILVEWRNVSYTGNGAFHYFRDYTSANVQLGISGVGYGSSLATAMNSEEGKSWNLVTVTSVTGTAAWNALANFTFLAKDGSSSWTGDVRISFYRGDYQGPYKPYVGSKLYSSKSEIKQTADSINLEVSKKVGANEIISKINQSPEEVTISASKVNISGAAIFSSGGAYDTTKTVVKSETQWYSSTSPSSLAGGSWSTSQPSIAAGRYIWQRELDTYANGSTAYKPSANGVCTQGQTDLSSYSTTAQANNLYDAKGAAQEAVDNLEISGRNLFLNTADPNYWNLGISTSIYGASNKTFGTDTDLPDFHVMNITRNNNTSQGGVYANLYVSDTVDKQLTVGEKYVLSFMVKASAAGVYFNRQAVAEAQTVIDAIGGEANWEIPTVWTRYWVSFTCKSAKQAVCFYTSGTASAVISVAQMQLEKATKLSAYHPALEDTEAAISGIVSAQGSHTILWNYENFSTANPGEAYICKIDPLTNTKSDVNPTVMWNGVERTITKQMVNPNAILPYNVPVYIVARLGSASATTATNYMVWYASGWKYAACPTPSAVGGAWTWAEATDIILGKFVETGSEAAFTECEIYNPPWSSKQLTTNTTTSQSAYNLANTANTNATNATAVVNVYPTAIDFVKGTATLAVSLCVGGAAKTPTSYKWTKGTDYTTSLGTGSTLAVTDLDAVYNCECTWS